ncbi:axin-related protein-like [Ambystoma mexicanum]|uniref:axin-related protein-like n=1 Tax=Ambystoma mexicanum TaxID=8296 RepID=UPI0037E9AEAD
MSSAGVLTSLPDSGRVFRETSLRPPVPGQETRDFQVEKPSPHAARFDLQTGMKGLCLREPEGCVAVDSRLSRWGRSLHMLLEDQDGATLFRMYLEGEGQGDLLSFWFACNGFRGMDPSEPKTLRTAKAIYRWYVQNSQAVSGRLKTATRAQVKEAVRSHQLDPTLFDQAQQEIQRVMEGEAYPLFLRSDICREYARAAEDSPTPESPVTGSCLPTLAEEDEFGGSSHGGAARIGKLSRAFTRIPPRNQRSFARRTEPPFQCYAPAASINDSEISSDALTEDSMSLTDGSVDGVPPYRSKKQQQREIHRSISSNGQTSLPFVPRTKRPTAEMLPAKPEEFAAKLTAALERVKKQREAEERLEERLQRLKEEEEKDEYEAPAAQPEVLPAVSCEDDPQSILDDHLSRVLKTPATLSPRSQSPLNQRKVRGQGVHLRLPGSSACHFRTKAPPVLDAALCSTIDSRTSGGSQGSKGSRKIDSCALPQRPEEVVSSTAASTSLAVDQEVGRNQSVWQWVLESAKIVKKHQRETPMSHCPETKKTSHRSTSQPAHLFLQDTSMPPLNAPNTLDQLEEARRRLVEEKKAPKMQKPRCVQPTLTRDRPKVTEGVPSAGTGTVKNPEEHKLAKKANAESQLQGGLAIVYYFCGERIPYMIRTKEPTLTLWEFKELLSKKGNYKYYFKKESQEFDCNAVFQEISEEDAVLPLFEEKIICKVERVG